METAYARSLAADAQEKLLTASGQSRGSYDPTYRIGTPMTKIVERLLATETDQQSTLGVPTLINPDGPDAVKLIEALTEALTNAEVTMRLSKERLDEIGKSTLDLEERLKETAAALNLTRDAEDQSA